MKPPHLRGLAFHSAPPRAGPIFQRAYLPGEHHTSGQGPRSASPPRLAVARAVSTPPPSGLASSPAAVRGAPAAASPPPLQVDEIFGTIQEVYFTVKPSEGVTAASFKVGSLALTLTLTVSPVTLTLTYPSPLPLPLTFTLAPAPALAVTRTRTHTLRTWRLRCAVPMCTASS